MDITYCACGHAEDEHGHDPKYPGSSACQVEGCACIAWERGEDESAKTPTITTAQHFKRRVKFKQQRPRK